jgi:hypothetical protein
MVSPRGVFRLIIPPAAAICPIRGGYIHPNAPPYNQPRTSVPRAGTKGAPRRGPARPFRPPRWPYPPARIGPRGGGACAGDAIFHYSPFFRQWKIWKTWHPRSGLAHAPLARSEKGQGCGRIGGVRARARARSARTRSDPDRDHDSGHGSIYRPSRKVILYGTSTTGLIRPERSDEKAGVDRRIGVCSTSLCSVGVPGHAGHAPTERGLTI